MKLNTLVYQIYLILSPKLTSGILTPEERKIWNLISIDKKNMCAERAKRDFWETVAQSRREVAKWPAWKKKVDLSQPHCVDE